MRGDSRSGFLINAHVLCLQGVGRAAAAEVTYIPAYKATSGTNIGVMNVANRVKGLQQQFKACQPFTSFFWKRGSGKCTVSIEETAVWQVQEPPLAEHKKQIAKFIVMGLLLN